MRTSLFSRASRSLFVVSCALLFLLSTPALAQDEVPDVTRTFAIENARVVQAPGQVIERATIIVRDGLITAIGADVDIPFDAQRIAADSLTVYAGFIDGLSYAAVEEPDNDENGNIENPGNPPNDRAGIQPQRRARDLLDPSDNDIESLREIGFTAAHVVPEGDMLPGSGSIIQLAGDDASTMVLNADASLYTEFEGAGRMYPSTPMAIIAKWRQLYREAERRKMLSERYAQNPQGMERPPSDPVHTAFFPVIDGDKPVFFYTEDVLEMHRALALQGELGFPMALSGLAEGFRAAAALQSVSGPLFLTLELPEDDEWKPSEPDTLAADAAAADTLTTEADTTKATTPPDPSSYFVRDFRTRSYEDTDDETDNLKARKAIVQREYFENAATLNDAGVEFSFASMEASPRDIRENLRTMIDNGLPEDVALAALTTRPAQMLGLDRQLGTVEEGKIANLVITNGSYFDEDSPIRFVFVDGHKFEVEEAQPESAESGDSEGAAEPTGEWGYTITTPQGDFSGTIEINGSPGDLDGTITTELSDEDTDLENLALDGNTLTFEFDGGQTGRISATVTISGDEMEGTLNIPNFGSAPIEGTRRGPQ